MPRTLQVLIGAACLVVIVGGGWIGFSQYAARAEAKRIEEFRSEMNRKQLVSQCDELSRKPVELGVFLRDACAYARRRGAEQN